MQEERGFSILYSSKVDRGQFRRCPRKLFEGGGALVHLVAIWKLVGEKVDEEVEEDKVDDKVDKEAVL